MPTSSHPMLGFCLACPHGLCECPVSSHVELPCLVDRTLFPGGYLMPKQLKNGMDVSDGMK